MLDDVCDGFLHNAIDMDFAFFVKQSINVFDATGKKNRAVFGGAADGGTDGLGQSQTVQLVWTQTMSDSAHLINGLRCNPGNLVQHVSRCLSFRERFGRGDGTMLDDQECLSKAIM